VIITWEDSRSGNDDIYAQRVNNSGTVQWTVDGIPICTDTDAQHNPQIVFDGASGGIIAWGDGRGGNACIYAQRVDSVGTVQWSSNGVSVSCSPAGLMNSKIISDGSGGAVIAWTDLRNSSWENIYAQRINSSGAAQWTANGVAFSQFDARQEHCQIVSDGSGGIIAAWLYDPDHITDYHLNSQRINGAGAVMWDEFGTIICTPNKTQTHPVVASDGTGGTIVTWVDKRRQVDDFYGNDDIISQRVNEDGEILWDTAGVPICLAGGYQDNPESVYDEAGCVVVAWRDRRAAPDNMDLYAQRIDVSGDVQWAMDGIPICVAADNQDQHNIISDGSGGTIIAWRDSRGGSYHIYAQRVNGSGTVLWSIDGEVICSAIDSQFGPYLVSDGAGGAIIAWYDYRNSMDNYDIYAQRINGAGTVQWTADGVPLCSTVEAQLYPRIVSDGQGGAIVSWEDYRYPGNIYAQRVDADGAVQWTVDGVLACNSTGYQYDCEITSDGAGGAFIAWYDNRNSIDGIYAQSIDASGAVRWSADGLPVCSYSGFRNDVRIVSDGQGGAVMTWRDQRNGNDDIFTQRVDTTGTLFWLIDGVAVCDDVSHQDNHRIVSDGAHGAFVAWNDGRTGRDLVYLHRITELGLGPVCEVSPVSIEIPGYIESGAYADTTFTITNTGFGTLTGYAGSDCDDFTIVSGGGQFSLDRGMSRVVTVRFMPPAPGLYQCTIDTGIFICSDVTVSGRGFSCPPDSVLYVDAGAVGIEAGSSWMDAFTDLSGALAVAPLCPSVTQVWVAEGTYIPTNTTGRDATFNLMDGLALCGGFDGTETILSQRDVSANETILSGDIGVVDDNSDNCYHVVTGSGTDTTAVLDGFIVEKGKADGASSPDNFGAGMLNQDGSPAVIGCVIRHNSSANSGAGMYNSQSDIRVRNTAFEDNDSGNLGGGFFQDSGAPSLIDVYFRGNSANTGGGMYTESCLMVLINGVFHSNSAPYTGAMGTLFPAAGSRIVNTSFNSNTAVYSYGCMYNFAGGSNLEIINVISWGNSASSSPEIFNNACTPVISHSDFSGCGGSGGGWDSLFGTDGGGNIDDDPLFFSEVGGDLRLLTGSPAIDAGDGTVPELPSTDIAGASRVQGAEVDMGAYEGATDPGTVHVTTIPAGLEIEVESVTHTDPYDTVIAIGSELELSAPTPQPSGDFVYAFTGWSDSGDTTHTVTISSSDTTFTAYFAQLAAYALIDSIIDVPDDQGGWARIYFSRSYYDDAGETEYPVTEYDMHRRIDDVGLAATVLERGETVTREVNVELPDGSEALLSPFDDDTKSRYISYRDRYFLSIEDAGSRDLLLAPPGLWEVLGNVSAMQQDSYVYLAPTLADSAATLVYTAFYISAHTTTPAVFFESPADSGYSVDNIAPGVPLGLAVAYNTGSGNELTWDPAPEPDFQYYRIYRGDSETFVPGPGNLVHETVTPDWNDPDYDGWDVHYKVTALDHVGNESDVASAASTTGDDMPQAPDAFALYQNVPNPFNPATTIRFDLPKATYVKLSIFNVKGELVSTIADRHMSEGRKEFMWTAKDNRGRSVSSGIYFYRLVAGDFVQTRKMVLLR